MIPWASLRKEARRLLDRTAAHEALEIYFRWSDEWRFEQTQGRLENVDLKSAFGAVVRCLSGGRQGLAHARDIRSTALEALVAEARTLAQFATPDSARRLLHPRATFSGDWDAHIPPAPGLASTQPMLTAMEQAARSCDARVRKTHQSAYVQKTTRHVLLNSHGLEGEWAVPEFTLSLAALAEDQGDSQLGEAFQTAREFSGLDPEVVGREAGAKAARLLGAQVLPTGRRTVIFPPAVATGFLEAVFPAWTAEAQQRQRSFLAGREGQRVAAPDVTVVDDGLLPGGLYSAPMDEEGAPTQRTVLIREGVLCGSLHTVETAVRAGAAPTGNGQRSGLSQPVSAGPTNFCLQPGTDSHEALRRKHPGALVAADVLGLHTLDPVSGEFSLGATGWYLSPDGETPVRGVTLSGNVLDWLGNIVGLAHDATVYGHFSAPTLAVRDVMVAGS